MRNSNYIYGSFSRLSDFPLDDRYLHETKEDLIKYVTSKPTTAHEGQLVYVINPGELYLIKNVTECILEPLSLDSGYGDLIDELKEYINRSKNNVIEDGKFSSAHGTSTITNNDNQFVVGKFNKPDVNALFMVGSGYDEQSRTNGLAVYDDGRVSVGKNPTEDMDVVTKKYLEDSIKDLDINVDIGDLTNLVEKDEFNTAIETINTELDKKSSKEYVSNYVSTYVEDALKDINLDIDDEAIKGIYEQHQADIAAHDARITDVANKANNLEESLNNNIEKTNEIDNYITKTLVPGINRNIDALIQTDNTLNSNINTLADTKADLSYVNQEIAKINTAIDQKAESSDLSNTVTALNELSAIVDTKIDDSSLTDIRNSISSLTDTKADKTTVNELSELINKVDSDLDTIADNIVENYATKNDLSTAIDKLVDSAPGTLDTLGEIAEALNNNKSVVGALSESLTTLSSNDTLLDKRLKKIEADYLVTKDISNKLDTSVYDEEKKDFATKTDLTNISYDDLKDTPTIPSIEGLATSDEVKAVSDSIGYESTDKTLVEHIDETYAKASDIPTKVSELTNDKSFVDIASLDTKLAKDYYIKSEVDKKIAEVASGGSIDLSNYYNKQETEAKIEELSVKKTSELENDSGFITANDIPEIPSLNGYATEDFVTSQGYLTEIPSEYAKTSDIPTKLEELSGYDDVALKSDLNNYSEVGHTHSQYLTSNVLSDYSTTSDINLAISTAISNIDKLTKEIVSSIDLENNIVDNKAAIANVIYLLLDTNATGSDIYKEYTVIDGKLRLIGDTSTDLSNYYNKDNIDTFLSGKANSSHTHSKDDIIDLEIPTKTSDLINDSGFITTSALSGYATENWVEDKKYLTELPDHTHNKSDIIDLEIPTKTSDLNNDSGFITSNDIPEIPNLDGYATENWVEDKKYLTELPDHTHTVADISDSDFIKEYTIDISNLDFGNNVNSEVSLYFDLDDNQMSLLNDYKAGKHPTVYLKKNDTILNAINAYTNNRGALFIKFIHIDILYDSKYIFDTKNTYDDVILRMYDLVLSDGANTKITKSGLSISDDTYNIIARVIPDAIKNLATKEDIKDHITSSDVYFTINGQLINNKGNISIDTNTGASVTTDAELDKTSANPIQNKPVATKFESVDKELEDLSKAIDDLDSREASRLTNNILSNTETYAITVSSTEIRSLVDILAEKGNGMYTCRLNVGYTDSPNVEKTFRGLCMVDSTATVDNKSVCSGWIFMIDTDNHCYSRIIISGIGTSWNQLDKQHNINEIDPATVIFKEPVETTYAIGNVTLTNGKGTLIPAGGSLMDFFNKFIQESSGTNANPSIGTISFTQAGKYYEVGYKFTPSVSFTFEDGKYTYGPEPTGVSVTAISMKDSKNITKTLANSDFTVSGNTYTTTFPEVTISSEGNQYRISDTDISYSAGSVPKSNLGNDYPSGKIAAGTISNKTSSYVIGYRPVYLGTFENKNEITDISTYFNGKTVRTGADAENFRSGTAYGLNLPTGIARVAFAYPKSWGECKEVVDTGAGNFNIVGSFAKSEIEVAGTYSSCTYYLYVSDFASGIGTANKYNIKIK